MKKVLLLVFIVITILAAGAGVYFYQMSRVKLSIEEILPEGVLGYARFSDVEKRLSDFMTTKFWKNISTIDVPMLMEKSGSSREQIEQSGYVKLKRIFTILSEPNTHTLLMNFLGQEVAIGFYPMEGKLDKHTSAQQLLSSVVLVTRLKPGAQIIESLTSVSQQFAQDIQTTTQEYKRYKIILLEFSKEKIRVGYVRVKDLLIFGIGPQAARMTIDVISKEKPSLSDDKIFQSARAHFLAAPQTILYGNLEFIFSNVMKQLMTLAPSTGPDGKTEDQAKVKKEMDDALGKVAGFKALGYSFSPTPLETHKFDVLLDREKLDPSFKGMYSCPPQENKTISFIPTGAMVYQWSNCLDLKSQWNEFKKELKTAYSDESKGVSAEQTIASVEKSLKLSIEKDILPAFGQEVGGYLGDINLEGPFPLPKLILFIQVADRTAAEKVIATLTANPQIVMQNEDYKNVQIKYAALTLGAQVQPSYCFLNGYLLLATNREVIKETINTLNGTSPALPVTEAFKNVNFGLTDKNNLVLFVKLDSLFRRLHTIAQWGVTQVEMRSQRMQAFKEGMKGRLEYTRKDLIKEETDLKTLNSDLNNTKAQLKNLQTQGQDVTEPLTKIDHLEKQIETKNDSIKRSQDNISQLEETMQSLEEDKTNPELTKLYVEKAIIPILDGLESYRALGSRAVFNEGVIESTLFLKKTE